MSECVPCVVSMLVTRGVGSPGGVGVGSVGVSAKAVFVHIPFFSFFLLNLIFLGLCSEAAEEHFFSKKKVLFDSFPTFNALL